MHSVWCCLTAVWEKRGKQTVLRWDEKGRLDPDVAHLQALPDVWSELPLIEVNIWWNSIPAYICLISMIWKIGKLSSWAKAVISFVSCSPYPRDALGTDWQVNLFSSLLFSKGSESSKSKGQDTIWWEEHVNQTSKMSRFVAQKYWAWGGLAWLEVTELLFLLSYRWLHRHRCRLRAHSSPDWRVYPCCTVLSRGPACLQQWNPCA